MDAQRPTSSELLPLPPRPHHPCEGGQGAGADDDASHHTAPEGVHDVLLGLVVPLDAGTNDRHQCNQADRCGTAADDDLSRDLLHRSPFPLLIDVRAGRRSRPRRSRRPTLIHRSDGSPDERLFGLARNDYGVPTSLLTTVRPTTCGRQPRHCREPPSPARLSSWLSPSQDQRNRARMATACRQFPPQWDIAGFGAA